MRPLFTIGIPVYNAMPYLPEAVESALRQTYPHFEVLIINDGSQDESLEYLHSLKHPRLRVLMQENRGLTATLNRMLEEARAPWLVRLDADDVACPERLARLAAALERWPAAGMLYSRASHYGHPRKIASARSTEGTPAQLRELTRAGYLLAIVHSSVALNVASTRTLGGYRFNLHIEDLDLWWRMALHHDIVFVPHMTVQYRLKHDGICINSLRNLSANTLFAQYLLLSNLWGLDPRPYEAVIGALGFLVDKGRLAYREQMWRAAAHLATRQYCNALTCLAKGLLHSPVDFLRRARYPLFRGAMVRLGSDPRLFRQMQPRLWPAAEMKSIEAVYEPA